MFPKGLEYKRSKRTVQQDVHLRDELQLEVSPATITGGRAGYVPMVVESIRKRYLEGGVISESHLKMVLMYAHVTMYRLLNSKVFPRANVHCRPMQHDLDKYNVPIDFGAFFITSEGVKSHPKHIHTIEEELSWPLRRKVPSSDTNERPLQLQTHVVPLVWFDSAVELTYPCYGYLTTSDKTIEGYMLDALCDAYIEDLAA